MTQSTRDHILARAADDPGFRRLRKLVRASGESILLAGARGGSRSIGVALSIRETERPHLVITQDLPRAQSLRQDLTYLLDDVPVELFPEIDIGVYTHGIAGMGVRAARLEALSALAKGSLRVLVAPLEAVLLRVPRPAHVERHQLTLAVGTETPLDDILVALDDLGYQHRPMVEEHGDYSRRGGIVDFYSFGQDNPIRIELDGDEVASIRAFDVGTQRSVATMDAITVLPTDEIRLTVAELEEARERLEGLHPEGAEGADRLIDDLASRRDVEGANWLGGLFPDHLGTLFDYFPDDTLVVVDGPKTLLDTIDGHESDYRQSYDDEVNRGRFFAAPEANFLFRQDFTTRLIRFDQLILPGPTDEKDRGVGKAGLTGVAVNSLPSEGFGRNMNLLRESVDAHRKASRDVYILCESDAHRERLDELLEDNPAHVDVGSLGEGFTLPDVGFAVIVDHEIWGRQRRSRQRSRRFKRGLLPQELQSLKPGDYVVHIEHGIGTYRGVEHLDLGGHVTDCLLIEYARGDKLYVPADQLDLIQRYSAGEGAKPTVNTIGGTGWQKLKSRVKKRIKIMAEELIQTYAKRRAHPGHAFAPDTGWQYEMEAAFPYDETPDQLSAIADVKKDMESSRPMDRLVCGDVGFGKTEVAIRAAFKAVMDGKQVAILVPTTLLAEQHLETFQERMKSFPIKIDMMSRFRTTRQLAATAELVATGKVDVLIGTHRILSKDVNFKDLGLLVIDEEQRFGVRHKEVLKKLRSQVDVLTLTATPIPRTLHMSLMGARDMSTINTPPRDRLPVHTEIVNFGEDVIVESLLGEADRGGQAFFVHNRVQTIQEMGIYLSKLVPELRIGIAHGQMPERQIERIMLDFHARKYDVLLTTMIIESGLDIPSVNTILINRADAFGLGQLYQLRGRVGRSARKAHAFLLVPRDQALTETAQKRLRVIDELEELGSGFQLAMRDLEIRGAGNMLGGEQSGFIVNVGFDMYCRLLDEAVRELKGLPLEDGQKTPITTDVEAYLSDDYVPDRALKVRLYKALADTSELSEIDEIEAELRDRFGPLPEAGQWLVDLRRVRLVGTALGASAIVLRKGLFEVTFEREMTREEVRALLSATNVPVEFSATGSHGFRISRFREGSPAEALRLLRAVAAVATAAGEGSSAATVGADHP